MDLMSVTTRDKIGKAIQDAIKDQRVHESSGTLNRCQSWKLSTYDVSGLSRPSGATSRTFLNILLKLQRSFENAEHALAFMHRARMQRTQGSRKEGETEEEEESNKEEEEEAREEEGDNWQAQDEKHRP
ncbi:hypothetical protein AC578_10570 [Pseudocercospora eumusae]|uniref:Uncharacterized protein n=1 Tax=Pseudocercospora eumusae TaxID=321146 RepID=A0A139H5G1_9PEZI|nr:hypothetical protein AC578_10570 [Pseudocercospora eumusae]